MTDPLDALRSPAEPVDPDPTFAELLRERLRRAVLEPVGATMTETTVQPTEAETEVGWGPSLAPYIVVSDARAAMDWYVEVLGATRRGELYENADGTIGHAEVGLGDAVLMFSEASDLYPEVPVAAPTGSTHSHTLHLQVGDVDEVTRRAAARGATVERPPVDQPYGRGSVIIDPFGHRWLLLKPPGRATRHAPGDVSYVTMVVADDEAAKAFYGAVFGWESSAMDEQISMWHLPGFVGGEPQQPVPRDVVAVLVAVDDPTQVPPHWSVDFWVGDLDATVETATRLGGAVIVPPYDVPGTPLTQAVIADPQGATMSVTKVRIP